MGLTKRCILHRLVEMEKVDGSLKLELAYDYMERRISKKVYNKDAADHWL